MTSQESSKERQILRMMKRVLTDIAKDTYTAPGLKHPLSDNTILSIRDCLALISARERELTEAAGETMNLRPRYSDEPRKTVVVPLGQVGGKKKPAGDEDNEPR